jgi:Xaa-Pro dipeptidase
LGQQLAANNLDALLVTKYSNVRYLTGFQTFAWNAPVAIATPADYVLCVVEDDVPLALIKSCADIVWHYGNEDDWIEPAAKQIRGLLHSGARMGFNGVDGMTPARLLRALGGAGLDVVDSGQLVESCRLTLSAEEQTKVRRAAVQTAQGLRAAVAEARRGPADDSSIAAALLAGLADGTDAVTRGEVVVASGWYGAITHAIRGRGRIERGTTTFLEFAGSAADYCAPVMRTLCHGEPPSDVRHLDDLARTALDAALQHLAAGVPASEVARKCMAALRIDDPRIFFHRNFGYPIGMGQRTSWMDNAPFHIVTGNHEQIKPGMAFHIPTSMVLVGAATVAHSQTVIVHEEDLEIVTDSCGPAELIAV